MSDWGPVFDLLDQLTATDQALRVAALTTHQAQKDRIFGLGDDANNGDIGRYSKNPAYISPSKSPRGFQPKGKTGKTEFADGTPHKTRYFERGYFEFRSTAGRQNSFVDLRLGGQMENDYNIEAQSGGYVSGFGNRLNYNKARGNEKHFGKNIFSLSNQEANLFEKVFTDEITKRL